MNPSAPGEPTTVVAAAMIDPGDFDSPTTIDFEDENLPAVIGDFYAADFGVTLVELRSDAGPVDMGDGPSVAACNFDVSNPVAFPPGELLFDPPVQRAGFRIQTNDADNTTITAFLDGEEVGSELFETGGATTAGGSFAGVEFEDPFDRLVVDAEGGSVGAVCIDNLVFEGDGGVVEDPLAELLARIDELQTDGVLNRGQAHSLTGKLNRAAWMAEAGRTGPALNVLNAFTNHVHGLVDGGVLDAATGEELLELAALLADELAA